MNQESSTPSELLRAEGLALSDEAIQQAVEHLEQVGRLSSPPKPYELQELKQLAQRFEEQEPDAEPVRGLVSTPLQRVATAELLRRIRRDVVEIRWRIGRQHEPLFSLDAYETEAIKWIAEARREHWGLEEDEATEARELKSAGEEIAERLSVLTGESWSFADHPRFLRYYDADGMRRKIFVRTRHTELWPLAEGTWRLHAATGFMQEDLVLHVLCGSSIELPRAVIRRDRQRHTRGLFESFAEPIRRDQLVVHLLTPDLDGEEVQQMLGLIRERWAAGQAKGAESRKRLEDQDAMLFGILSDLGYFSDLSERVPRGFWTTVADEWHKRGYSSEADNLPEALRIRAHRLKRDLPQLLPISMTRPGEQR